MPSFTPLQSWAIIGLLLLVTLAIVFIVHGLRIHAANRAARRAPRTKRSIVALLRKLRLLKPTPPARVHGYHQEIFDWKVSGI